MTTMRVLHRVIFPIGIVLIAALVSARCVSVQVGGDGNSGAKSSQVKYWTPPSPFEELKTKGADRAWQHRQNGNSIGFQSSCDNDVAVELDNLQKDLEQDFRNVRVLSRERKSYNGREALFSEIEGRIEGVMTRLYSVVFRKNSCSYSLTYLSAGKHLNVERMTFESFVREFFAP